MIVTVIHWIDHQKEQDTDIADLKEEHIIDEPVREAYCTNPIGRTLIQEENPEDIVNTVFTMWGDTATLEDPVEELVTE